MIPAEPAGPTPAPAAGIVTPEAVLLAFDDAGLGSRCLAFLVDLAVRGAILWATAVLLGFTAFAAGQTAAFVLGTIAVFGVVLVYPVACETALDGRTPGKMALGLRVVTTEGGPVRFRHAAIRGALGIVDFLVGLGAVAVVSALVSRRSRRLGDLAAGTVVIRERATGAAPVSIVFPAPPGWESYVAGLDVTRLPDAAYVLVRAFLLRVHELDAAARWRRAAELATTVAARIGANVPAGTDPEGFLVAVAAAYQARHRAAAVAVGLTPPPLDLDDPAPTWGVVPVGP